MKNSTAADSKPDNYPINARICQLVERHPCMYDRSHPLYLKKDVVDKAWVKISKEMDDSIPSCKERWRNIRTSFARSINVNKVPSSANRTKPYYLHEELKFLARHITPGVPVSRRPNYYSSAGEDSEMTEMPNGEESIDGFGSTLQDTEKEVEEDEPAEKIEKEEVKPKPDTPNTIKDIATEAVKIMEQLASSAPPSPLQITQQQNQEETQQPMEVVTEPDITPITTTLYPLKKRIRTECMMMLPEVEPVCDVKPAPSELAVQDSDFDAGFLQGLLPEMKAMDFRQKILFKRRIYEVISEIFEGTTNQRQFCNGPTANGAYNLTDSTTTAIASPHYTNRIGVHNKSAACTSTPTSSSPSTYGSYNAFNASVNENSGSSTPNASNLELLRRLTSLLQNNSATQNTAVTALPKNVGSISSTVPTADTPPPATVAIHPAVPLTRAYLMRVNTGNQTMAATSSTSSAISRAVKQEILED